MRLLITLQILWAIMSLLLAVQPVWINPFMLMLVVSVGPLFGAAAMVFRQHDVDEYDEVERYLDLEEHGTDMSRSDRWIEHNIERLKQYRGKYVAVDLDKDEIVAVSYNRYIFSRALAKLNPDYVKTLVKFYVNLFV